MNEHDESEATPPPIIPNTTSAATAAAVDCRTRGVSCGARRLRVGNESDHLVGGFAGGVDLSELPSTRQGEWKSAAKTPPAARRPGLSMTRS